MANVKSHTATLEEALEPVAQQPILGGEHDYASVSDHIGDIVLKGPRANWWWIAFTITSLLTLLFFGSIVYLVREGVGIWGLNHPVIWGFAIANYVWWIAIAMAGTFISAVLHLTRQDWGRSISRFAETMTVFALVIAGLFPIIHLGRPWFFYWLMPYPNATSLWPQWMSPLVWDFFAILAYLLLSLMFWYLGLLPDFATLRDRAQGKLRQWFYGLLALGWRGSARNWHGRHGAHVLLAGLAVPLVVSVHSVVGLDFAAGNTPVWHSTIFPPFFVAGAMFSGFAMAMTLAVPLRKAFALEDFITARHLDNLARLILVMGLILAWSYLTEIFIAFYSANPYEEYTTLIRMQGPYAPVYWSLILCVVVVPQLLWWRGVRHSPWLLFVISIIINIGMWLERFIIIVSSLHRDFLPSTWGMFYPTFWDWAMLIGSIGFFGWMFLLSIRLLPLISISELRELLAKKPVNNVDNSAASPTGIPQIAEGKLYGLVAEFSAAEQLRDALQAARDEGYRALDALSPMPVQGISERLGLQDRRLLLWALFGAIVGGVSTFVLQWYSATLSYPLDIGGRSPIWPALIPATFEMTILGAVLCAFFGSLWLNGLPRLNHPLFDMPGFERVSRDRFFLCIEASDAQFDRITTAEFLATLKPLRVTSVAASGEGY